MSVSGLLQALSAASGKSPEEIGQLVEQAKARRQAPTTDVYDRQSDFYGGLQGQTNQLFDQTSQPFQESTLGKILKWGGLGAMGLGALTGKDNLTKAGALAVGGRMGAEQNYGQQQDKARQTGVDKLKMLADFGSKQLGADEAGSQDVYNRWLNEQNIFDKDRAFDEGARRFKLDDMYRWAKMANDLQRSQSGSKAKEPYSMTGGQLLNEAQEYVGREQKSALEELQDYLSANYTDPVMEAQKGRDVPYDLSNPEVLRNLLEQGVFNQEQQVSGGSAGPLRDLGWNVDDSFLGNLWGGGATATRPDPMMIKLIEALENRKSMEVGGALSEEPFRRNVEAVEDITNERRNRATGPSKVPGAQGSNMGAGAQAEAPPPKPPDMDQATYERMKKAWAAGWRPGRQ